MGIRMDVPLRNLIVWHDNPRAAIEMSESEDEAIDILFEVEGKSKMLALATDVAEFGLNSHRQPIVVRNEDMNSYIVFDGNRRISVLKLLAKGDKRVEGIENHINVSLDTKVFVYVTNRDEALRLIEIEHSGEQGGKGQIDWDAYQRDYALNNMNKVPAYPRALRVSQICNLFHKKDFKKIPYTDLETIFNNVALKRIFKISADWDFEDEATIRNVYSKLIENKPPKKPYSRYLVKLNELGSEYEKFKMKVLDNEALENPVGVTPSVGAPPSA
ncbi:ParB/Srx family N-terminal domain-containing protein, partial [Paenibacillus sp. 1-18]|uniref:ParB/Srx family N-terminal domain-containing protein n=1 Tax=Paenibacillus sp. 1-18 TaxID=1333846 RepID=UPI0018CBF8EB